MLRYLPTLVHWHRQCIANIPNFSYSIICNCNINKTIANPLLETLPTKIFWKSWNEWKIFIMFVYPQTQWSISTYDSSACIILEAMWIPDSFSFDRQKLRYNWFRNLAVIKSKMFLKFVVFLPCYLLFIFFEFFFHVEWNRMQFELWKSARYISKYQGGPKQPPCH